MALNDPFGQCPVCCGASASVSAKLKEEESCWLCARCLFCLGKSCGTLQQRNEVPSVPRTALNVARLNNHGCQRIGYLGARVEHTFGSGALHRFARMRVWRFEDMQLLKHSLQVCAALMNADILAVHGLKGRYAPMDADWKELMVNETAEPIFNTKRWNESEKRRLTEEKKKRKAAKKCTATTARKYRK